MRCLNAAARTIQKFDAFGLGVGEHVFQGAQTYLWTVGDRAPTFGQQSADLINGTCDGGAIHIEQQAQDRVQQVVTQVDQGGHQAVDEDQTVPGARPGGSFPRPEPDKATEAIRTARAATRHRAWTLAAGHAPPSGDDHVVIDIDATVVIAHSDKENAAPTWKKTFGFHPICAFADHGSQGTGEPLAVLLRPGNAGANTAADHITTAAAALRQLPRAHRRGRKTLIRTDTARGTHDFLTWLTKRGRWLSYSVGMTITDHIHTAITKVPAKAWTPAYDADHQVREGAFLAEITGMVVLFGWPAGMRLIVRKERPHPGAKLRVTDRDGNRLTCFATNTATGQLADLELRHRRRARAEDRIRCAKDTGLANLPLHSFAANRIWAELVMLALDLIAWAQMLALAGQAARWWEPKRQRLRLFSAPARLAATGRRLLLRLNRSWPWVQLLTDAIIRLRPLPAPV